MSSTPDPRYGAVLEILTRVIAAPMDAQIGPFVDELLATVDSVHHFDEPVAQPQSADDAFLRSQALDLALRMGTTAYSTADNVRTAAETFLGFLRGDSAGSVVPAHGESPGDAPEELHDAIDRAWSQAEAHPVDALHRSADDDDDVLEALQQLGEDQLARTVAVLQVVRALAFGGRP